MVSDRSSLPPSPTAKRPVGAFLRGPASASAAAVIVLAVVALLGRWTATDAHERVPVRRDRFAQPSRTYHGYDEVRGLLEGWIAADPERVTAVNAGVSQGGLMVPAVAFTSGAPSDEDTPKRTILLIGALDGHSQSGSEAVLHTAFALLDELDHLPPAIEIIAIPWASPDGLARVHAGGLPSGRNMTPVDDDEDGRFDEDGGDDIDGDGQILEMLVPDPDGLWCQAEDPRFLALAGPGDSPRFRRTIEGRDDDGDGRFNEDAPGGIVLDQQFPLHWTGSGADGSAGRRPLSEDVARRLADLVLERDVAVAFVFQGNHGGVAFPQPFEAAAEGAEVDDVQRRLALAFERATGRAACDGHPVNAHGGRAIDWMHGVLGITAIEVAVWGPCVVGQDGRPIMESGRRTRPIDHSGDVLGRGPALDDEQARWVHWLDDVRGGQGFLEWHPVDIGSGLFGWVGGWEPRTRNDPPEDSLMMAIEGIPRFVQEVVVGMPSLSVELVRVERVGDLVEIDVRITNRGVLPTGLADAVHPDAGAITVRVEAACDAAILAGAPEQVIGALAGREISDTIRWVVAAPAGSTLRVTATAPRAGSASREVRP